MNLVMKKYYFFGISFDLWIIMGLFGLLLIGMMWHMHRTYRGDGQS